MMLRVFVLTNMVFSNNYNPNYKNTRYAGANPGRGGHTGTRPARGKYIIMNKKQS